MNKTNANNDTIQCKSYLSFVPFNFSKVRFIFNAEIRIKIAKNIFTLPPHLFVIIFKNNNSSFFNVMS